MSTVSRNHKTLATTVGIFVTADISKRADELLQEQKAAVYKRTDRLFASLLIIEWLAGILVALVVSPLAWAGRLSTTHIHVWTALFLGAAIIGPAVYLALRKPGATITRHAVAIAQMLWASLLIHLTGGTIEAHFHIFGSLAFLAFYRDWRVLVSASLIAVIDHVVRGYFFPLSIYGVTAIEPWRWVEHIGWVVFEDTFLIKGCQDNVREMAEIAVRQAEVEGTRDNVESIVHCRTAELKKSEERIATQYAVTKTLAAATSLSGAATKILSRMATGILHDRQNVRGIIWTIDPESGHLTRVGQMQIDVEAGKDFGTTRQLTIVEAKSLEALPLIEEAKSQAKFVQNRLKNDSESAFSFPLIAEDKLLGVIGFFYEDGGKSSKRLSLEEISMFESLGHQIGDFALKVQVEQKNLQLANMIEWSRDAIIGQSVDGMITSWNRGAESFFGYTSAEMKGKHISKLSSPDKISELDDLTMRSRSGDAIDSFETEHLTKSGRLLPVLLTQSPVFDDTQRIVGISSVMHNISERKDAERRVSEFYSIVSHELRTPLTSIRGVLGLIENGVVEAGSEEASGLLIIARESTDRLIRLINDMLDLKKIEAGKMQFDLITISAPTFVEHCLAGLTGMSDTASVSLRHCMRYRETFWADQDKSTQVLTNLISNAIKFSPPCSEVKVVCEAPKNSNMVLFKVIDEGPGISAADQAKLFEKFQQVDASDSRSASGTGLGLAISKALVSEMGGKIGLDSKPGMGSIFWFELPAKAPLLSDPATQIIYQEIKEEDIETDEGEEHGPANFAGKHGGKLGGKRILLVEDDHLLAGVLQTYFRKSGYAPHWVNTMEAARAKLLDEQEGLPWADVIVLDMTLPDGSGLSLLETLKKDEVTASIPVIVISGRAREDSDIGDATVADWLPKPFHSDELLKVVDRVSQNQQFKNVVVADKDTGARRVIGTQIEALGLICREARTIEEAIELSQELSPDLVIVDVAMTENGALEALKALRFQATAGKNARRPIIIYSGNKVSDTSDKTDNKDRKAEPKLPGHNKSSQLSLMDAMTAILGDLCK